MSYKVMVLASGETEFISNALRYPTKEMAEKEGNDLACRWLAVRTWRVEESPDPVHYYPADGGDLVTA